MQTISTTTSKQMAKFSYWHLHLSRKQSLENMKILKKQNLVFDFSSCVRLGFSFETLLLR